MFKQKQHVLKINQDKSGLVDALGLELQSLFIKLHVSIHYKDTTTDIYKLV